MRWSRAMFRSICPQKVQLLLNIRMQAERNRTSFSRPLQYLTGLLCPGTHRHVDVNSNGGDPTRIGSHRFVHIGSHTLQFPSFFAGFDAHYGKHTSAQRSGTEVGWREILTQALIVNRGIGPDQNTGALVHRSALQRTFIAQCGNLHGAFLVIVYGIFHAGKQKSADLAVSSP